MDRKRTELVLLSAIAVVVVICIVQILKDKNTNNCYDKIRTGYVYINKGMYPRYKYVKNYSPGCKY